MCLCLSYQEFLPLPGKPPQQPASMACPSRVSTVLLSATLFGIIGTTVTSLSSTDGTQDVTGALTLLTSNNDNFETTTSPLTLSISQVDGYEDITVSTSFSPSLGDVSEDGTVLGTQTPFRTGIVEDSSITIMASPTSSVLEDATTLVTLLSFSSGAVDETTNPGTLLLSASDVEGTTDPIMPSSSRNSFAEDITVSTNLLPSSSDFSGDSIISTNILPSSSDVTGDSIISTNMLPSSSYVAEDSLVSTNLLSSSSHEDLITSTNALPSSSDGTGDSIMSTNLLSSNSDGTGDSIISTNLLPSSSDGTGDLITSTNLLPSSSDGTGDSIMSTNLLPSSSDGTGDLITSTNLLPSSSYVAEDSLVSTNVTSSSSHEDLITSTNLLPSSSDVTEDSTSSVTLSPSTSHVVVATTIPPSQLPSSNYTDSPSTVPVTTPSSNNDTGENATVPGTTPSSSRPETTSSASSGIITTLSTKYPTLAPNLDKAVFIFTFDIEVTDGQSFSITWLQLLKPNLTTLFRSKLKGFKEVKYHGNLPEKKRRHARSTDRHVLELTFSASDLREVDSNVMAKDLEDTQPEIKRTLEIYNYTLDLSSYKPAEFAALTRDVCKSQTDHSAPLCTVAYNCTNNVCRHLCEDRFCGGHGQCYVYLYDDAISTKCQCSSEDMYDYQGDECDRAVMKERYVAVITGSVCGAVVLLLVVAAFCTCRHFARKSVETPREEMMSLDQAETWSYESLQPKYYSNHGYKSLYMAYVEPDPAVHQFRERPRARSRDRFDVRLRDSDLTSFHRIDSDRRFSIRRPQVSSTPVDPE